MNRIIPQFLKPNRPTLLSKSLNFLSKNPFRFLKFKFNFNSSFMYSSLSASLLAILMYNYTQRINRETHCQEEQVEAKPGDHHKFLPVEYHELKPAPYVPPPITRTHNAIVKCDIEFKVFRANVTRNYKYDFWSFNGMCPGPFIRTRVGDVLEVNVTNSDDSGMPHNIDFHAVMGPGGGAALTTVYSNQKKTARFKLKSPGLFVYHCAAAPIPLHVANGMYGLILVEPDCGLTKVDHEFYIMQSEFYFNPPSDNNDPATSAYDKGLREQPDAVVFNGREGALTDKSVLKAKSGETIRLFFGNAGPNLISSFHAIGTVFDKVYREGDLISPPARHIQSTLVPAGGSTVLEFKAIVPGNYTFVDHSIFRIDKGAIGFLNVSGEPRPDIYYSKLEQENCVGCKVHP